MRRRAEVVASAASPHGAPHAEVTSSASPHGTPCAEVTSSASPHGTPRAEVTSTVSLHATSRRSGGLRGLPTRSPTRGGHLRDLPTRTGARGGHLQRRRTPGVGAARDLRGSPATGARPTQAGMTEERKKRNRKGRKGREGRRRREVSSSGPARGSASPHDRGSAGNTPSPRDRDRAGFARAAEGTPHSLFPRAPCAPCGCSPLFSSGGVSTSFGAPWRSPSRPGGLLLSRAAQQGERRARASEGRRWEAHGTQVKLPRPPSGSAQKR